MSEHSQRVISLTGDIASGVAVLGTLAGILPPLVAIAALLWYAVQIWESDTVQGWIHGPVKVARRKRAKYRARSILHTARNQAMVLQAEREKAARLLKEQAALAAIAVEEDTP